MIASQKRTPPRGRPFKKGDARINKHGPVSEERRVFSVEFNNAIAKRADMTVLVDKLLTLAEHGVEWAMKEVLDRTLGKVSQPLAHSGELSHVLSFAFGENGNGKEHE
jgi:hypothetical protein